MHRSLRAHRGRWRLGVPDKIRHRPGEVFGLLIGGGIHPPGISSSLACSKPAAIRGAVEQVLVSSPGSMAWVRRSKRPIRSPCGIGSPHGALLRDEARLDRVHDEALQQFAATSFRVIRLTAGPEFRQAAAVHAPRSTSSITRAPAVQPMRAPRLLFRGRSRRRYDVRRR